MEIIMKFTIKIPKDILTISKIFITNGYELYLVGGCVRDALLEIRPKDYDLVTNALPDTVIDLLSKEKIITNIIETGKNFGVINAITARNEYEIATFRKDQYYENKDLETFKKYLKTLNNGSYELFINKLMK